MEPMTFDIPGAVTTEIQIPAGDIGVEANEDGRATVHITGERNPDDIIVECSPRGGGHVLRISTRNRKAFSLRGGERDLRVHLTVPAGSDLDVETASADLEISGEIGTLSVRTASGDLSFDDANGDVAVKAASGDVRGGAVGGSLVVHSASGDLRSGSVGGSLVCRTASGDLEVERVDGDATVTTASGDIRLGAASRGTLTLKTVSGDIDVGVASGTAVWLDLTSATGDAVSDLDVATEPAGGATMEVRAAAVSGDVRVHPA